MKPLLPGVVHCKPMVWVTNAMNRKTPSTAPYIQSRRVVARTVRGMTAASMIAARMCRHSR